MDFGIQFLHYTYGFRSYAMCHATKNQKLSQYPTQNHLGRLGY